MKIQFNAERITRLDDALKSSNNSLSPYKLWVILCVASLSLFWVHYLKYSVVFRDLVTTLASLLNAPTLLTLIQPSTDILIQLLPQAWWCLQHIIGFIVIPMLTLKCLGVPHVNTCWRWGRTHDHALIYIALTLLIMSFAVGASFRADFLHTYPFYRLAHRSWLDLIGWEVIYLVQFICVEFFFRGFLLHSVKHNLGVASVFVMTIPYVMLHFQKPWLEAFGAFGFGIILGLLSLLSRSIWGGVLVHISIALTMDLLSLFQQNKLPTQWLP